jgi:GTP-binding protein HflX
MTAMSKTTFATQKQIEKAFLVGVEMDGDAHELDVQMRELKELTRNAGYAVAGENRVRLRGAQPRYLMGGGNFEETVALARSAGATTIVFNDELSASQQRNWETDGRIRTVDRQEIILEIFESRARTREAVLQVQLARLEYMLPRLKKAWTHLERQHGGGTGMRGAGEKQLELDQRMVRDKISQLKRDLEDVRQRRATARKTRERVPIVSAAIVGYTNAGKSTLLNTLTGAEVLAEDKLFATLDPTTRRLSLPNGQKLTLTDTVGFIRRLPHTLVDAFKATLEETVLADFLIHVVDLSDPEREAQERTTLEVLKEIGAAEKPVITAYNKMDVPAPGVIHAKRITKSKNCCFISATTGQGLPELVGLIERELNRFTREVRLLIPHSRYDLINMLHEAGGVTTQKAEDKGVRIRGFLTPKAYEAVKKYASR